MKSLLVRLTVFVIALSVFAACEQEEIESTEADEVIMADELEAVAELTEAEDLLDEDMSIIDALDNADNSNSRTIAVDTTCRLISVDHEAKLITIEFEEDCQGSYGRVRSGKILVSYTGSFEEGLGDRTVTFENYYVGKKSVSGTITFENLGENDLGQQVFVRTQIDHKVIFNNGAYRLTNGATTRVYLEGYGDGIISNNLVEVTGGFETESNRGTFSYSILEAILLDFDCKINEGGMLRSEGIIEIAKSNSLFVKTRTVDYGTGCDNEYTVTVDEDIVEVTL